MTARQARALRTERQHARSQANALTRRTYAKCLAGEQFAPARGQSCSVPSRDVIALYAKEFETSLMTALGEIWPCQQ
jgi:hypothetical protein